MHRTEKNTFSQGLVCISINPEPINMKKVIFSKKKEHLSLNRDQDCGIKYYETELEESEKLTQIVKKCK
jgi:hypothetical protein